MTNSRNAMFLAGSIFGVLYGLFAVAVFHVQGGTLASVSFLALVPAALGFMPLVFVEDAQVDLYRKTLFIPWVSLIGLLLVMGGLRIELVILVALAAPFILVITLAVWIIRGLHLWRLSRQKRFWATAGLMVLPFITAPREHHALAREEMGEVRRTIVMRAPPHKVWDVIVDPREIRDREYGAGLFAALGVPHPAYVETVDPGMRATQSVYFSDGDYYEGEITGFDPAILLMAAPDHYLDLRWEQARPGTLHAHLGEVGVVELRRFDYVLAPAGDGRTRLTMVVRYALTTSVNPYARFWVAAVIDDTEEHLLSVFKRRAERRA